MLVNNDTMFDRDDDNGIDIPEGAIRSKEEVLGVALEMLGRDLKQDNIDDLSFDVKRDLQSGQYTFDNGLSFSPNIKTIEWTVDQ